ncbi:tRNA preQ1(34) S-adenosylmethionine ribosyltransferase-isomerase QueA [Coprothermobacter platensis]|uniref:tRNA preQ1(34) S-adenosylmethionine ribosyltransferase-isomerase QueA n=1 Tax=Coprothermobacter platensis TaxID=108819 RepID=UPI00036656FC|nr:tRNA preQ1(34) S-adenosylmethionine ribosyltransferase-isomerase QueA [Coprothermobacter platensis]
MTALEELLNYDLPKDLIAQELTEPRDRCRMLVLHRDTGVLEDKFFYQIAEYIKPGDVLVLNNTKVLKARVRGIRQTGGAVEILLVRPLPENQWECLIKPLRRIKADEKIILNGGAEITFVQRMDHTAIVQFYMSPQELDQYLNQWGEVPTPPYIKRKVSFEEYQTVYAEKPGAVAAPTAGLHFTNELLKQLEESGIKVTYVTLHVALGTFEKLADNWQERDALHQETFFVSEDTIRIVNDAKRDGKRIFAVGTTTVRSLESAAGSDGVVKSTFGDTSLFIKPGYTWKVVDKLITNFHLPQTSLLLLVSSFATPELILKAYKHAIDERYRFYSLGDAMLIL